jgi:hypothetical protein
MWLPAESDVGRAVLLVCVVSKPSREAVVPHEIHERSDIQSLIDSGTQVVEVLGP